MAGLNFLYRTLPGRCCLKLLSARWVSGLVGALLDTRASQLIIRPFSRRFDIDQSEYDLTGIGTFNQFFCRPIKEDRRPVCHEPEVLIAPCDGLLKVIPVENDTVLPVKQSAFSVGQLLRSKGLSARYEGGLCLVFRLCVNHYHRYCYIESGKKSRDRYIPGRLNTVRPVALRERPVFCENSREYCLIKTETVGTLVQMEVGAMLVGKIRNKEPANALVRRGNEKGHFEYGGSTIIVLIQKDRIRIDREILTSSAEGAETPVKMGQKIGSTIRA